MNDNEINGLEAFANANNLTESEKCIISNYLNLPVEKRNKLSKLLFSIFKSINEKE